MPFVESPTGDFQDLPLWRHLAIETMAGPPQRYPHPWVAPTSLINAAYRVEIPGGIRGGIEVREFVLTVPEDQLRPVSMRTMWMRTRGGGDMTMSARL
jgi:hypothetical protein